MALVKKEGAVVGKPDPRVMRALDIIECHLCDHIDAAVLLREIPLSSSRLRHVFKQHVGVPRHIHVQKRRVAKAEGLLTSTSLSVKEIACAVGWHDVSHFVRAFEREIGLSPRRYRSACACTVHDADVHDGVSAG